MGPAWILRYAQNDNSRTACLNVKKEKILIHVLHLLVEFTIEFKEKYQLFVFHSCPQLDIHVQNMTAYKVNIHHQYILESKS